MPVPVATLTPAGFDPRRHLLGAGVARDYRAAAGGYANLCAGGCGDLAACRALATLVKEERGLLPSRDQLPIAARMCARHDPVGCGLIMILMQGVAGAPDEAATAAPCVEPTSAACDSEVFFAIGLFEFPTDDGPPPANQGLARVRGRLEDDLARLCVAGRADACGKLLRTYPFGCDGPAAARCALRRIDEANAAFPDEPPVAPTPVLAAGAVLVSACRSGDADACALTDAGPIDPHVLCRAGDLGRCAELARAGDKDAAALACQAGQTHWCDPATAERATVNAMIEELRQLAAACAGGDGAACAQRRALVTPAACPAQ